MVAISYGARTAFTACHLCKERQCWKHTGARQWYINCTLCPTSDGNNLLHPISAGMSHVLRCRFLWHAHAGSAMASGGSRL
jgi:hypothetical protein